MLDSHVGAGDEYVETDPVTGEKKTLALDEKEKLYLDCLDAFYNEGGKQLLSNDECETGAHMAHSHAVHLPRAAQLTGRTVRGAGTRSCSSTSISRARRSAR